ncbi:MAG: DUF1361 domain-containing protein [Candidatus Sericytochromatia bacterium]|nr:DUF1361 domain-containing protein [Candidatus Sericytochromatia bacterium]
MKTPIKTYLYFSGLLIFSCSMVAFRLRQTQTPYYGFLLWNLFLAVLPLGISHVYLLTHKRLPSRLYLLASLTLWLLFFPNAPYIITDLMHLGELNRQMPDWYDPLMLFATATCGLWAGFVSLQEVEGVLESHLPRWGVALFTFGVWFLSAIGIYLGRVLRWNSWDFFRQPGAVLQDVLEPFLRPEAFPRTLGMIILFTLFLWLIYGHWKSQAETEHRPVH